MGIVAVVAVGPLAAEREADFQRGVSLYRNGEGDPADFPEALESFKLAAGKGDAASQFHVGRMYHLGDGVPVDLQQAELWYRKAGENGHAVAWSNLGNVYAAQKKGADEILACFQRASEAGSARGSYNMGQTYRGGLYGTPKDYARAIDCYRKTLDQQPDFPLAWNSIGWMHERGGPGVDRDLKKAEEAYLSGARESDDKECHYSLYWLYQSGSVQAPEGAAIDSLEKAARHGQTAAALRGATHYLRGWDGKRDMAKAAHFYDLGARWKHGGCLESLAHLWTDKDVIKHHGEAAIREWKSRDGEFRNSVRKQVPDDLVEVRRVFGTGDEEAAGALLDGALARWNKRTADQYHYFHSQIVWSQAQVGEGRADHEWGRFLFSWVTSLYEEDKRSSDIIGARINLNSKLVPLGRYGLLRKSCEVMKTRLREIEGIDVDSILAGVTIEPDYSVSGAASIPVVVDVNEAVRSRHLDYEIEPSPGEPIGGQAMTALTDLATERLSVGDWRSVLIIAEWIKRWNQHIAGSGASPGRSYPGCIPELDQIAVELRANAFAALGLPDLEASALLEVIGKDLQNDYGGRHLHEAHYRLAGLRVDQGRAREVDLDALAALEERIRKNTYVPSHTWQFAKLVRARVLAEVATHEAGIALVREVLAGASERELPLLRLEALLASAELELKAGDTGEVAARLEEALGWARGQGLLLQELRIHELYVRYLIATGQHARALEMQRRIIELIDALNLAPRRERALLRLAEIHLLLDEVSAARSLLADIKDPTLRGEAAAIAARLTPSAGQGAGRAADRSVAIDLQPLLIRSVPRDWAAEAVFILTNPNPEDRRVEVTFESGTFRLAEVKDTEDEVVIDCDVSAGPGERLLPIKAVVPGAGQLPISLVASGLAIAGGEASVRLKVNVADSPAVLKSEWEIDNDGKDDVVAVVDAARLRNNAFCLVPVFHHVAGSEGRLSPVALRMVASEPTRIEGFAPDGTLLFVDAQGNGSFRDPGDLVATAGDLDLCPVVKVGEEGYRIALRYAPQSRCENGRVEVRIETKEVEGGAGWKTDAVDWLEP